MESHNYIAQGGWELMTFLPQPPSGGASEVAVDSHTRAPLRRKLAVEHDDDTPAVSGHDGLLQQEVLHLLLHVQVHSTLQEGRVSECPVAGRLHAGHCDWGP